MGHGVVHFEFGAADDEPLVAFYRGIFGWDLQSFAGGGYTVIDTLAGAGINGGIGKSRTGAPWSAVFGEAQDPQGLLGKTVSLGASTVRPVTEFGGAVAIATCNAPVALRRGRGDASARSPAG